MITIVPIDETPTILLEMYKLEQSWSSDGTLNKT